MLVQIALGTGMMVLTIAIAGLSLWVVETLLRRAHTWLTAEPHGPKMMALLCAAALWIIGIMTVGVWLWAGLFLTLGVFHALEESVYFSLVSFTTLGYGDLILPRDWRLLGGMCAANGFMTFGLLVAMLVEGLRQVRLGQIERGGRR
jgi:hypothetical protein